MTEILEEYFDALERLKKGVPTRVKKGTKITKDSVALEAGRSKGAIKKSRVIFKDLIIAIDKTKDINQSSLDHKKIFRLETELSDLRKNLEKSYGRELSLLYENYELKNRISKLESEKLITFKNNNREK